MTGYMAEMRKLVGHRTLIQCSASIIIVDDKYDYVTFDNPLFFDKEK